ncbi:sigma-70 family RNA polymerase sigma factor [Desulfosporosinus fructosivorans]|uniref:Sigma-70 family RNA polymerase sigma factor n=1 Tax=Desulfosporosinus fructosivorans TaxID=2018669 RepID=A0A4Z0R665_9FIRM|nr:sigma-70 family RNA polymerase sigma factor [Desulfosporosinus fructosivorans]TGE38532.1 sigma-70 family RNA polymerase sigma factor [Desulfosporosinus fructosivorans]
MQDDELIRSILKGNGERYDDIVERYQAGLYRTAFYYTQNVEDARDIAQEIFIKAYNSLAGFKQDSSFSTWLYRIAVNHCIDWSRKKKPFIEESTYFDNLCDKEGSAEDLFIRQESASEVHRAVASLPTIYSTVLILYYFEDFSPQQIADIIDSPKRTVETRLFRGRNMLKDKLQPLVLGGERDDVLSKPKQLAQLR